MKKLLVILVLLSVAAGAFAIDLSMGVGGAASPLSETYAYSYTYLATNNTYSNKYTFTPFAATAFLDATYAQISAGYAAFNGGNETVTINGTATASSFTSKESYLTFAAFAKYPFKLGPVTVFPLLGAEYDLNLTYTDSSGNNLKSSLTSQQQADLNLFWIKGGAGVDISLGKFYLRPELLGGVKLLNTDEQNSVTNEQSFLTSSGYTNVSASLSYWTWDFALMVGYKL